MLRRPAPFVTDALNTSPACHGSPHKSAPHSHRLVALRFAFRAQFFFFFFYKEIPKLFFVSAAIGLRLSFVVFLVWGRGQLNLTRNERRSMLMTRPRKVLRLTISTEFYCAGGGRSIRETSQSAGPGSASSRDVVMSQYGPCRSNVERITRSANDAASLLSSRKLLSVLMKAQQRKTGSS